MYVHFNFFFMREREREIEKQNPLSRSENNFFMPSSHIVWAAPHNIK